MKFQLLKLIIWPKDKNFSPQVVEFELGKLNVITGASRTGKSAIIPIIDYCLASSECFIPIDTIRDYSSWFGIVFQTQDEQILICRKTPQGNKASDEYFLTRGLVVSVPPYMNLGNEKEEGIKQILNSISAVPYFSLLGNEERPGFNARMGFRDLMALVFQNQDIVANQNILFYKTHAHEHREKLRNWFPYILGAETIEVLVARQKLQDLEKRLIQLKREFEKAKSISESWLSNMRGHLNVANQYGLVGEIIQENSTPEELLLLANSIISNIPNYSLSNVENIETSNSEIRNIESEEEKLSLDIGTTKKRLNDIHILKSGLVEFGSSVKKRVDRLHISQWIKDISHENEACPACGSTGHPQANLEILKISAAFKKYEDESKKVADVPTSLAREELRLSKELESLIERRNLLQNRYDAMLSKDKEAQAEFQSRKNMFLFLGHLKASSETFKSLTDSGDYQNQIEVLQKEFDDLSKINDAKEVQRKLESAVYKISQGMLSHLQTLDVDSKYRKVAPKFDIKNLNLSVLGTDDHWHFLSQVGSASNWLSFHIALMCSLQEYFLSLQNSCVPSFVIFDQPSQVYFPKLKRAESTNLDNKEKYQDEDVEAVKNIFKTIANSINASSGNWQGIILDHADDTIYGDIKGVHQVAVWRNGKKLIPEEWYKELDEF